MATIYSTTEPWVLGCSNLCRIVSRFIFSHSQVNACRGVGYAGNIKLLWHVIIPGEESSKGFLAADSEEAQFITLDMLDPQGAADIKTLREIIVAKYGCVTNAWTQFLNMGANTGVVDE